MPRGRITAESGRGKRVGVLSAKVACCWRVAIFAYFYATAAEGGERTRRRIAMRFYELFHIRAREERNPRGLASNCPT